MPRRRSGSNKGAGAPKKSFKTKKADASVQRWNTVDDIPLDEVDQFHAGRDKILLEGEEDFHDDGDEDEVFGLKGLDEDDEDEDEDMGAFQDDQDFDEDEEEAPSKFKSKKADKDKKSKSKKKGKSELSSDEEEEDKEEEEESWGTGKVAYYNGNDDELDSDDEEGHELELQEAKRLQAKAREDMTDEDFGLNDVVEVEKDDIDIALEEPVVAPKQVLPTEPKALLRHLEKTSPEAVALARDWEDVSEKLVHLQAEIQRVEKETPNALSLGMQHLYYQTLLSYSTILAFYLHLRATEKYAEKPHLLQTHPIMSRLLTLKQALITLEDLDFAGDSDLDDEDEFSSNDEEDLAATEMKWDDILADRQRIWDSLDAEDLDEDELRELIADANADSASSSSSKKKKGKKEKGSKSKSSKKVAIEAFGDSDSDDDVKAKPSPKKKRKVEKTKTPVFDLEEPEWEPAKKYSSRKHQDASDDAYGEASHLQHADAADKSARKKTLRFHISKIESASARRSGARNQAVGGDDDIPYRERQKQKELRLEQEARMRLAKQGGADLDDEDVPMPMEKRKREDMEEGSGSDDGGDEYYELIKKKSKVKKVRKKEEYEAARAAEKPDYTEETTDGPRSLTRAIIKNRGLTPYRSKAVRNSRVKKRQAFEKAKKKVSSQKAIYKGGLAASGGNYGGEQTGISKVVKSVRLG